MRKILIVGGGTSGLHLAHGLLSHGYDVTVINGASSQEIRGARPAVTQFTLPGALAYEQASGLARWDHLAPRITGITLDLHPPDGDPVAVESSFATWGISVDRRVRAADWLESFEDRGGMVVVHGVTVTDLDYFSRMYDLIVVAVGHGELGRLFDPAGPGTGPPGPGTPPRRVLAQAILDGIPDGPHAGWHPVQAPPGAHPGSAPEPVLADFAEVASAPGLRAILSPVLTPDGPQHVLQLIGPAGGPMERWPRRSGSRELLALMLRTLTEHAPGLAARVGGAELLHEGDAGLHSYSPHVRAPVGSLPSGGAVLGMADVVVSADDPIAAQANTVSVACANHYLSRILGHGGGEFTRAWMEETFAGAWTGAPSAEYPLAGMGRAAADLSRVLDRVWDPDAPAHLALVLGLAAQDRRVADRFLGDLDDPRRYADWLTDADAARAYLAGVAAHP
ncbi:styrene monooxygenase/indole monooxygenase family protein [Nocardiopsis flavescens]|uniref:styrene monooxygenase/indole monooxygenase family protein n=1 Tax=Nocardiopsis flavescens TaxID=758803 RepID=UPI003663193F